MRKPLAILALSGLIPLTVLAQTSTIGPNRDPVGYKEAARFSDELLSRKAMEATRKRLSSRVLREALKTFEPGRLPELRMTWGEFISGSGVEFEAVQFSPVA